MLEKLSKRLKELGIDMTFDKSAVTEVALAGYDDVYGARPLRRAIQSKIEDVISERILDSSIKTGDELVCVFEDGEFVFKNSIKAGH